MKLGKTLVSISLLISTISTLSIPLKSLYRLSKLDGKAQSNVSDATNGNVFNPGPGPGQGPQGMDQLLALFENFTNMTAQELASDVFIQNYSIATAILKFWKKIVMSVVQTKNSDLFEALNGVPAQDFLNRICCKAPQQNNAQNNAVRAPQHNNAVKQSWRIWDLHPASVSSLSSVENSASIDDVLQRCNDVKSESLSKVYGPEMSYETLQKWIEDYGLSASSLRDYLETYLFAGDHSWVAKLAAQGEEDVKFDLRKRLALLGANIDSALAMLYSEKEATQEAEGLSTQSPTQINEADWESQDQLVSHTSEGSSNEHSIFQKRGVETQEHLLTDYSPLVHSFSRIDEDAYDVHIQDAQGQSWDDWDSEEESLHDLLKIDFECFIPDFETVGKKAEETTSGHEIGPVKDEVISQLETETVNKTKTTEQNEKESLVSSDTDSNASGEKLIQKATLTRSMHRIFDNDEIVVPLSEGSMTAPPYQPSVRSKNYRQVIYADHPFQILSKRDEDCVPVTWYNVFHHSVFGKQKFCHV